MRHADRRQPPSRLLEEFVQDKLFIRSHGRLELTSSARACVAQLSEALDQIDTVLCGLSEPKTKEKIIVVASPSFTSLWLLPRLQRFKEIEPAADVILNILSDELQQGTKTDIWIASSNTKLDMRVEKLMGETIIPVCAPKLLAACGSPDAALRELPLIHDEKYNSRSPGPFPTWERYLTECGLRRSDTRRGLRFNQSSLAMDAAIEGHGMLLGRSQLIGQALAEKRLVQLGASYPIEYQYFVVSAWQPSSPAADRFRDWLLMEANTPTAATLRA